jgi:hypothetical protein
MVRRILPLFILALLAVPAVAQTTTTYTVTSPVSGVYSTPFRAFSIPLSDGAAVSWLEVGANTSCAGQSQPAVGFIFLTIGGVNQPCIPLTGAPGPGVGTFSSDDGKVSGSYSFDITTAYHCSGGRGGCHTSFTIHSGTVTVTEP